jgi:hypothetical protein
LLSSHLKQDSVCQERKLFNYIFVFSDMKKTLEFDPSNDQAKKTIRRLEPLAAEKREKMKEEMIGELKGAATFFFLFSYLNTFLFF